MRIKVDLMLHLTPDEIKENIEDEFYHYLKNNGYNPLHTDFITKTQFLTAQYIDDYNIMPEGIFIDLFISADLDDPDKDINEIYTRLNHLYKISESYTLIHDSDNGNKKHQVTIMNSNPSINHTDYNIYMKIPDTKSDLSKYKSSKDEMNLCDYINKYYPDLNMYINISRTCSNAIFGPFHDIVSIFNFDKMIHEDFKSLPTHKTNLTIKLD